MLYWATFVIAASLARDTFFFCTEAPESEFWAMQSWWHCAADQGCPSSLYMTLPAVCTQLLSQAGTGRLGCTALVRVALHPLPVDHHITG